MPADYFKEFQQLHINSFLFIYSRFLRHTILLGLPGAKKDNRDEEPPVTPAQ
jgi:hypothetical protein